MKIFTLLFAMCVFDSTSFAQAGTLDKTFGHKGKVYTPMQSYCYTVALQPDGKILVGGSSYLLIRYMPDGSLDSTFNGHGIASAPLTLLKSIHVLDDGKIMTAGTHYFNMAIAKFKENGTLDSSFGENGITINPDHAVGTNAMQIQKDGKMVLAGFKTHFDDGYLYRTMFMTRANTDGSIDSTFGGGGGIYDRSGNEFTCLALQEDGKIVVAGHNWSIGGGTQDRFSIRRYDTGGKLDKSFGTGGKVIADISRTNDVPYDIAILKDGKILVAGVGNNSIGEQSYMTVVKYNSNGTLDRDFGEIGAVRTAFRDRLSEARGLLVQQDGKLILTGFAQNSTNMDFALVRLNPDGSIDSSFGINGKQTTAFGGYDRSVASVLQEDGKIILVGYDGSTFDFLLSRYKNDLPMPERFNNFAAVENNITIHLSPNPVKDILHIEGLSSASKTISVTDIKGKLLQQITTAGSSYSFNTKQLSGGIYFLRIAERNKISTMKFLKK